MGLSYVLITPARNEEAYIEQTLRSVVAQSVQPLKWVIVSDGSTDSTDEIVQFYAEGRDWLELIRAPEHADRDFAAKVNAFNVGYATVRSGDFDLIGNIDADVSFPADYFEYLIQKCEAMPELGVAGTDYTEGTFHSFEDSYINPQHVNGQIQLFRRRCFEDIDGYQPSQRGGIDWIAVTKARMKGWKTQSFHEKTYVHHRKMGTANSSSLKVCFNYGFKDYFLGGHPVWELFRAGFQMTRKPYIVGGITLLSGYLAALCRRYPRQVSEDLMAFHRQEQMTRLKKLLSRRLHRDR